MEMARLSESDADSREEESDRKQPIVVNFTETRGRVLF